MHKGIKLLLVLGIFTLGFSSCNNTESPVKNEAKVIADKVDENVDEATKRAQEARKKAESKRQDDEVSSSSTLPKTSISFDKEEHHFGTIDEGDKVETVFTFTNTGNEDLIIEKCKGSCGCTVPECPKQPIPPGGSGEIKVVFNSKGKKNKQEKRVTVTANTDPLQTQLKIKADVTPEVVEETAP